MRGESVGDGSQLAQRGLEASVEAETFVFGFCWD